MIPKMKIYFIKNRLYQTARVLSNKSYSRIATNFYQLQYVSTKNLYAQLIFKKKKSSSIRSLNCHIIILNGKKHLMSDFFIYQRTSYDSNFGAIKWANFRMELLILDHSATHSKKFLQSLWAICFFTNLTVKIIKFDLHFCQGVCIIYQLTYLVQSAIKSNTQVNNRPFVTLNNYQKLVWHYVQLLTFYFWGCNSYVCQNEVK